MFLIAKEISLSHIQLQEQAPADVVRYSGMCLAPGAGLEPDGKKREGWREEFLLQKFPLTAFLSKPNEVHGWCDQD